MLKTKFKFSLVLITTLLLVLISTTCFAAIANKDVALEIVENNVCTMKLNDYTTFEKKIIDYDLNKKEITIGLKVTNNAEPVFDKPTEIFLVIDNSTSMQDAVTPTANRLKTVTDSAKQLATELLKKDTVKIGIVKFSTGDNEGTITDATLLTTPSNSSSTVLSAITSIAEGQLGPRTNIDAGITLASQNFTENAVNKFIILLTDGVPNTAVGGPTFTYSGGVATKTKAKLVSLSESGIKFLSMMTGVQDVEEPTTGITYKELAAEVFGTSAEPTVGKFYYIPDTKIEETICQTILEDIAPGDDSTLTDLKIYDYFPQEIVDNFNFSYVAKPTKGTISDTINAQNNNIVWSIDKLQPGESASVSYKLTLKDNVDTSVLDRVLNTNAKIEITANEIKTDDGSNVLTSTVSPKIKLTAINDSTTTNTVIPQTGSTPTLSVIAIALVGITTIFGIRAYIVNRK